MKTISLPGLSSLPSTRMSVVIGNLIEWYDFALFGYLSYFMSQQFFPKNEPNSLLFVLLLFACGLISRVIGGIAFALWGDTRNRDQAVRTAIIMMSVSSLLIGCLPNYSRIGVTAPILLLLLRNIEDLQIRINIRYCSL